MPKDLKEYRFSQTKTVTEEWTPEEVYTVQGIPEVPEGYEVVDFRIAQVGINEPPYLGVDGVIYRTGTTSPRFILKEKPKPEVIQGSLTAFVSYSVHDIYGLDVVSIPLGWKFVRFDRTKAGERFLGAHDGKFPVEGNHDGGVRIVVEKIK